VTLRVKRRFEDAIAAYTKAIGRIDIPQKSDWAVFYSRGVAFERAGKWPLAEADLKMALQLFPGQPFVLNYLGYTWADMGRNLAEARTMIQAAAIARKNDGAVTDSLGWVMFRMGDVASAISALERAVELEPEDSTISDHLGDVYYAAGRKLEARYEWKRALTLNPTPQDTVKLEAKLKNNQPAP
jgi:Flp pilus assembly protein TadD